MNDRFKFRVFYKPHNKIYNVICLNSDRQKEITIEYKGSTALVEWENCDILQCTGLKDKNGKLVYEGDIISKRDDYLFPVYWGKTHAGFRIFVIRDFPPKRILGTEPLNVKTEDYEIIGNIYENEELMNIQSSVFGTINLKSLL